ncbi:Inositol transporter 4 [Castilleja foliolosa]|uniref:Inositol transporter 4 n=1 Tax=Castilleja foliolosa TaxID=1961234 RepID=A0ABD3CDG6_9LAMI
MESGVTKPDKTEFTECWRTSWQKPYIMRLALSAGIGGLLFGYDTGVISGALLYIRDEYKSVDKNTWLQETIVSMAVAGAIVGAGFGGLINDKYGRRKTILLADILFFIGAVVMAASVAPWMIIVGRIFVGFGVGMASMSSPLYISEASPARIRGALVSTNGLLITGGQFLSYLINLAFTKAPGTWRWMLGVAGIPALIQLVLMLYLPESPRWLYRKDKVKEARAILEKIYPANEVEDELKALKSSIEAEKADQDSLGDGLFSKLKSIWNNNVVRRGLYAGVTVQVAQQFVGINTVMYYSPTIVQLAGFASNKTALALSLITSGLNAVGSIVSMVFVDRYGRRRLMIISMFGIIVCLVALSILFHEASDHAPRVGGLESARFGRNATCSGFLSDAEPTNWNCMTCLKASPNCAFCANGDNKYQPGACLAVTDDIKDMCNVEHRIWYTKGCPTKFGIFAILLLGMYIISFSPGMGTVPWIVNSEIYPLRYRGIGGGIAAVSNWVSNLIVSETFLTLTEVIGSSGTFLLFAGFSTIGLVAIYFVVPETKGLQFEEVEKMLEKGFKPRMCCGSKDNGDHDDDDSK